MSSQSAALERLDLGRGEAGQEILETADSSLLDIVDHLLTKGVVITGEATLGVAGIDLVYLRLSVVLCAADRVLPKGEESWFTTPAKPRPREGKK